MATSTRLKNRSKEAYDEAADTVERGAASARRMGRKAAHRAEEAWDDTSHSIEDMATEAGRKLSYLYNEGSTRAQESAEYAREAVQSRPLAALAGAFVAGLFASALFRR
jgi:ElaB/YqjD/DUF883 family membrane-anchored ribosome-binding protein